ncbi:MAG: hypothetical protein M3040_17090 [Bacteroidota bacterium]|nr:hypothetical protein [Bacteroidota bacterium]
MLTSFLTLSIKGNQKLNSNETDTEAEICDFRNSQSIIEGKDIFIAEYNSLRSEIHQRLSQQTTICQIAITVWGVILGYAFDKINSSSYNGVYLILGYPLLAFFISYAWAFNNIRNCQIGGYLRKREKQLSENFAYFGWETYVYDLDKKGRRDGTHKKVKPGIAILIGTQGLSIVGSVILITVDSAASSLSPIPSIIFLLFDVFVCAETYFLLIRSNDNNE